MLKPTRFFSSLLFVLLGSTNTYGAMIGPVTDLVIKNAVISPDGYSKSAVLPEGVFPGPVIRGNKGDRFQINVINELKDPSMLRSTSIHWHGVLQQQRTNWDDGMAGISQCPIAANNSFLYDFPTVNQAGTFWYHSHLYSQYCDGLRGPLILYDPEDPHKNLYDVDDESTIITLADWFHVSSLGVGANNIPTSQSTLINGKGRYPNGPAVPLSVVNVQHGKRYRFRILGLICSPALTFSIDGHNMTVIEVDGQNTLPLLVDSIEVSAGQRYSVVVTANQPVGNYWIRANPDVRGLPGFDGGRNSAILQYRGAKQGDPTTTQTPSVLPLIETNMHPLSNPTPPGQPFVGGADVVMSFNITYDTPSQTFLMNGHAFKLPSVPVILQIMSGTKSVQDLLPQGSYYTLPPNKVIEINIPGQDVAVGGPHPFHLHGFDFSVIRSANSSSYNFIDPVRRDTVSTGLGGSNLTIRFTTDNTGPWLLHCHIAWHLGLGMAVVMVEDIANIPAYIQPSAAWEQLCPIYESLSPDQL